MALNSNINNFEKYLFLETKFVGVNTQLYTSTQLKVNCNVLFCAYYILIDLKFVRINESIKGCIFFMFHPLNLNLQRKIILEENFENSFSLNSYIAHSHLVIFNIKFMKFELSNHDCIHLTYGSTSHEWIIFKATYFYFTL